ncbi:hypothetical protein L2E82_17089 [Cichorium intybus]|uniref:Uncharacterized protein n=1 Tax=Cichorium intybus TaxID=13427 RepID=A0ACB9F7Y9_CICIN|nr:hypothetical protein L2E82_17089 [Cichorium intybus]
MDDLMLEVDKGKIDFNPFIFFRFLSPNNFDFDYSMRISIGYAEAEKVVASSLAYLTSSRSSDSYEKSVGTFQQCPLNIRFHPPSEAVFANGKSLKGQNK